MEAYILSPVLGPGSVRSEPPNPGLFTGIKDWKALDPGLLTGIKDWKAVVKRGHKKYNVTEAHDSPRHPP